jgi:TolB protein
METTQVDTTPEMTASATIPSPPTSTSTQNPVKIQESNSAADGLIVFAQGDGIYTHLFTFGPDSSAITRLTADNWNETDPSVSPDGKQLAFSSDRSGYWEIYLLDLRTDELTQFTHSNTYDGAPSWSPDGQFIVYQTLDGNNLDLVVQSTVDASAAPIQLTQDSGDNFDPDWSADGHTVAFISNRSGSNEVWTANLQSLDNRFNQITFDEEAQYHTPRWAPDGTQLAWCKVDSQAHIERIASVADSSFPTEVGLGCQPAWSEEGQMLMAVLDQANQHYLTIYRIDQGTLAMTPVETPQQVLSYRWLSTTKSLSLATYTNLQTLPTSTALFEPTLSLPAAENGRKGVVQLQNVDAPQPYLSDTTDEAFAALRKGIGRVSGWDFLASLEDAYLPLTSASAPSITQNWLYTGRAIAVNTVPMNAGWMAASREDFNGQTYWRVWIKCLKQDGSCGQPMTTATWNFSSRFDSDPVAYENGGKIADIPTGYWIDFTEFSARYGWERLPSQANWRYYYPGILFNEFVYPQGMSWREAMLDLYPADAFTATGPAN